MKTLSFILCILFSLSFFSAAFAQQQNNQNQGGPEEEEIEVVIGIDEFRELDFSADPRIQIGNEQILETQLIDDKEVTLRGRKPGKTTVTIRNKVGDIKAKYLVTVVETDQSKIVQELRDLLSEIEGLEIGIKGGHVFVGGEIVVPNDIGKVVVVLNRSEYQDVLRLVEVSAQTQRIIAKKMQEEIQESGLRDVTVRVVNGLFWLEGVVSSGNAQATAEQIANAYIPDRIESLARRTDSVQSAQGRNIIQNFIQVNAESEPQPIPKLVKVSAQFVEVSRNYNKVFGFSWTPLMSGSGGEISIGKTSGGEVSTNSSNTLSATISNLFPKLSSAKNAGYARVIQSGVVIIKDGVQGSITKQSTQPFSVGTGEFARAEEATAGFSLEVTPEILEEENIDLNLGVTVSSSSGSPPETAENTIQTNLVVKSEESAVVGGVVVNKNSTDYDKDPPFGEPEFEGATPIFSFLRSKSHQNSRNQFAIFITPEIVQSASEGTDDIKRKFRRRRR